MTPTFPSQSHDEAAYDALSDDEASHEAFSHSEAPHGADEAFFHASAASFLSDSNSRRGFVMHLTGDSEDPEVGRPLVKGDKNEV